MPRSCLHFKLADFVKPGESYHFAQTELTSGNAVNYHDHDFHELFWIARGTGQHLLNGRTVPLQAGRMFLIRPEDRHHVTGSDAAPLRILNLAFPTRRWAEVRRRYFPRERDPYAHAPADRAWPLDARAHPALEQWAERLSAAGRPRVVLDGFLMELPGLLHQPMRGAKIVPEWLEAARSRMTGPEQFAGGTLALAKLAGRSPSHVARMAVSSLGQTPTEIVNTARMDYSARQLGETSRPIMDIALDCGLTNLSHFYALFRRRFGVSPRKFRLQAHPTVRGSGP
ncbi:MAG: AraC family transcriptional regulator [Verrucomicrobia bacterium]|nr:AraC family transcriptional regulator [Verrucomicrobiota bacterium]